MKTELKKGEYDVGVIVARFQLDELHLAHEELINTVIDSHYHTIIVLGLSPHEGLPKNPLDFRTRKLMVQEKYPNVDIVYISDMQHNDDWSAKLDNEVIKNLKRRGQTVCLYGGRDSFIKHYQGKYPTRELVLQQSEFISSTARRKEIYNSVTNKTDFRKGIIYQSYVNRNMVVPYVIVVIFNEEMNKVLIGHRISDRALTFITNEVKSNVTLEQFALQTVRNKTGIEPIGDVKYMGSYVIDDWTYRGEDVSVLGTVFATKTMFGIAEAKDDLKMVKWVDVKELPKVIENMHKQIAEVVNGWQWK